MRLSPLPSSRSWLICAALLCVFLLIDGSAWIYVLSNRMGGTVWPVAIRVLVFAAALIVLLTAWARATGRHARAERGLCCACGYDLRALPPTDGGDVLCTECGCRNAGRPSERDAQMRRHRTARRVTVLYLVLTAPACLLLAVLTTGWLIAHWIIDIPDSNWVQTGEHASLDALGAVAMILLLPGLVSLVTPVMLPVVLVLRWHATPVRSTSFWLTAALLALCAMPVVYIAMPMLRHAIPFDLLDWWPD